MTLSLILSQLFVIGNVLAGDGPDQRCFDCLLYYPHNSTCLHTYTQTDGDYNKRASYRQSRTAQNQEWKNAIPGEGRGQPTLGKWWGGDTGHGGIKTQSWVPPPHTHTHTQNSSCRRPTLTRVQGQTNVNSRLMIYEYSTKLGIQPWVAATPGDQNSWLFTDFPLMSEQVPLVFLKFKKQERPKRERFHPDLTALLVQTARHTHGLTLDLSDGVQYGQRTPLTDLQPHNNILECSFGTEIFLCLLCEVPLGRSTMW